MKKGDGVGRGKNLVYTYIIYVYLGSKKQCVVARRHIINGTGETRLRQRGTGEIVQSLKLESCRECRIKNFPRRQFGC